MRNTDQLISNQVCLPEKILKTNILVPVFFVNPFFNLWRYTYSNPDFNNTSFWFIICEQVFRKK